MDWDKLRIFYNVADSGNFTRAAERLNSSQSAVSRHISGLENRMGVSLFHRHARGLDLTEQGELLFRTIREVFSELAMVQARITENIKGLQEVLKITSIVGFGTTWLAPRLYKLLDQHPELCVTLKLSDNPVDLMIHEADVSITCSKTDNDELIYREFLSRSLCIYSSRSYLFQYGIPLKAEDLDRHRLIVFSDKSMIPFDSVNCLLTCGTPLGVKREPHLSINDLNGMARAVQGGSGIACLPPHIAEKCKGLVQILPEIELPKIQYYCTYSRQLADSKRIDYLWNFLKKEAQEEEAKNSIASYI
jgi:DNA-binding transcriptional LysR family regulator